jgi:MFS family permease
VLIFSLSRAAFVFTLLFGHRRALFRCFSRYGSAWAWATLAIRRRRLKASRSIIRSKKRPFAQSLLLSTGGIGGILARQLIGVNMIGSFGWRSIYLLMAGMFALALLVHHTFPAEPARSGAQAESK